MTKKKVAKKVAKKVVKKKAVNKKVEPVVEKLAPAVASSSPFKETVNDTPPEVTPDTSSPGSVVEPSHMLTDEYNPDDEHEPNAFGYGWSYDEGLDSPEELDSRPDPLDEDSEYAKGKAVGFDLEKASDDDDDMY